MATEAAQTLTVTLSASDTEKKVQALTQLHDTLSASGFQSADNFLIISGLRVALSSSNGHVLLAALKCTALYFTQLAQRPIKSQDPKHAMSALVLCSSGSLLAALADSKERTRDSAREALLAAASFACIERVHARSLSSSSRSDDILADLERSVKEQAFGSKSARAREQACLFLAAIRKARPTEFPLRPFVANLVACLEDSDPVVRTCAQQTVIEIFSQAGPSARADLKKELARRGTRKGTTDSVLAGVMSDALSSSQSEIPHDGSTDLVASSSGTMAPASALADSFSDVRLVFIASPRDLDAEISKMLPAAQGKETEHNWQAREAHITTLRGMFKSSTHIRYGAEFAVALKNVDELILKALSSLRTTLATSACQLCEDMALLGPHLETILDVFLAPLLRMAGQNKKIVATASQASVSALLRASPYSLRSLQYLWVCINEKTVQARMFGIQHVSVFVDLHGTRSKHAIEAGEGLSILQKCITKALTDANPQARSIARSVLWKAVQLWPQCEQLVLNKLDPANRRQAEKANPNAGIITGSTSVPLRQSVRSMIQATKAKRSVDDSAGGDDARYVPSSQQQGVETRVSSVENEPKLSPRSFKSSLAGSPSGDRSKTSPSKSLLIRRPRSVDATASLLASTNNNETINVDDAALEELEAASMQAEAAARQLLEVSETDGPPVPLGPGDFLRASAQTTPVQYILSDSPELQKPSTAAHNSWWHRQAQSNALGSLPIDDSEVLRLSDLLKGSINTTEPFRLLAKASSDRPCPEYSAFWSQRGLFDLLLERTCFHLANHNITSVRLEDPLLLLRSLIAYQGPLLAGKEGMVWNTLLELRNNAPRRVCAGAEAIPTLLAHNTDPLLSMGSLRDWLENEEAASKMQASILALKCLGQVLALLPSEVLEEELGRVQSIVKSALNSSHPDQRLAAVQLLVACHRVLQDQSLLLNLVGVTPAQEALLLYYFSAS